MLLLKYVFSHLINSNFKLCYSYSLNVVNFIIFLQLVDQSNKLFFLLFNINIISLQILVFLFAKNIIELCIKIANDSLDSSISLFKLLPTFRVCNSYFNCLFLYMLWYWRYWMVIFCRPSVFFARRLRTILFWRLLILHVFQIIVNCFCHFTFIFSI